MSDLVGRQVKSIKLHTAMHVDGFGQAGPTVDKVNSPKQGGKITMVKEADGVFIQFTIKTGVIEAFVPNGNIVNITFEPLQIVKSVKEA